jgi:hypothetical protein
MLTAADEWHVHQTPEPLAVSGTDRNFYDRSFFGAYRPQDGLLVGGAFGIYPNLGVADAHLTVVRDGVQHCLHASKTLHGRRDLLEVGPIRVEVVEPLRVLRLVVEDRAGLSADVTFTGRHFPIEEPRFIHRVGPRAFMDYTRLSQAADVAGRVVLDGETVDLAGADGLRDRSWGIRPVGLPDPQPHQPPREPQFFWLWTPVHLPDGRTLFWHCNADAAGRPWNTRAVLCPPGSTGPEDHLHAHGTMELELHPGTRWVAAARLHVQADDGTDLRLAHRPVAHLEMQGLGYRHPRWTHGTPHGELEVEREALDLRDPDPAHLHRWHRQLLCEVEVDGADAPGRGVLEHLVIGPYAPLGLS